MQDFNLENQWKKYLKLGEVKESDLMSIQKQEMRRAFFGGMGQMMILIRDEVGLIKDEEKAVEALQDMLNQIAQFWNAQNSKVKKKYEIRFR